MHVTFPLLANLYLLCTLVSTLWTVGDFTTVYLVSGGGPAGSTEVPATLGFHYAFDASRLGIAVVMSALPVRIPITIVLMEGEIEFDGNLWPPSRRSRASAQS